MDFKKLRTFQCAAQTLNFSEASNQLGYVQSAVTNQIKALEEELNVRLFERNGRGVELTSSGEQLFQYTRKLMALRDEAKSAISNATPEVIPIRIGGHETVITYYLPWLLTQYCRTHPDIRFSIQPTPVADLKYDVLADNLDLAFILEKPFIRRGLKIHTYQLEDVVVVCSASHPLLGKPSVHPYELRNEHLLLTERGCCYRNQFERILINEGAYNRATVSEFVSIETIKECVKLNMGIAALSLASVTKELERGELKVLNVINADMASYIHCIYDEKRTYPEYLQSFLSFCESFKFATK